LSSSHNNWSVIKTIGHTVTLLPKGGVPSASGTQASAGSRLGDRQF